jgi:hypothetical protein
MAEPTEQQLEHSRHLKLLELLELVAHVGRELVVNVGFETKPQLKRSGQTLPNVLVAVLDTLHVVVNPLDGPFVPLRTVFSLFLCLGLINPAPLGNVPLKLIDVLCKLEARLLPRYFLDLLDKLGELFKYFIVPRFQLDLQLELKQPGLLVDKLGHPLSANLFLHVV